MGRRMLISISLDSLFSHERVMRVDELELVVSQSVQLQIEQLFWVESKSFCHGDKSAVGQSLWCIWGYSCLAREQYFAIQTNPTRKGPDSRHLFPAGRKAVLPQANNEVVTCFFCISTHYGLKVWNNENKALSLTGFLQTIEGQTRSASDPLHMQYRGLCAWSPVPLLLGSQQGFLAED